MDFITAIKTAFVKTFTFEGRASRPEFWWFNLFILLAGIITQIIDHNFFSERPITNYILFIAIFFPSLSLYVRRLQDRNYSGWWVFPNACASILYLGMLNETTFHPDAENKELLSSAALMLLLLGAPYLIFFLFPGTPTSNNYGPVPREQQQPYPTEALTIERLETLHKLHELLEAKAITNEEYEIQKARILSTDQKFTIAPDTSRHEKGSGGDETKPEALPIFIILIIILLLAGVYLYNK